MDSFSPAISEKLGYYVYLLIDPRGDSVFYVGKGCGNRIFAHVNQAIDDERPSHKLDLIREIRNAGHEVRYLIHRHGLTEEEAIQVEASLIDYIGLEDLANEVLGLGTEDRGQMTVAEAVAKYDAKAVKISEPAILIILNRRYRRGMHPVELYEATRGNWVIGSRRQKVGYGIAVHNGIVREVYRIDRWAPSNESTGKRIKRRWRFEGVVAEELRHYVGCSVANYIKRGAQNPIKYVNC